MSYIPSVEEAFEILKKYNKDEFHLRHGQIVSGVLGYFAQEYDPENVEFWKSVGMLHDLDFELYPDQHCIKEEEIMRELDIDERVIHACISHGYLIMVDTAPELYMEKVLYAVDELTGLIGAAALMRPSKSVDDMEAKSVKKKFKTPSFAAGCSREVIQRGADMMGMDLSELFEKTILAMRSLNPEMGL